MEASGLVNYGLGKQGDVWSIHLPGAGFQVGAQTADRLISEGLNRSMQFGLYERAFHQRQSYFSHLRFISFSLNPGLP